MIHSLGVGSPDDWLRSVLSGGLNLLGSHGTAVLCNERELEEEVSHDVSHDVASDDEEVRVPIGSLKVDDMEGVRSISALGMALLSRESGVDAERLGCLAAGGRDGDSLPAVSSSGDSTRTQPLIDDEAGGGIAVLYSGAA